MADDVDQSYRRYVGTWEMEGSWPFSDSWHVTALWQQESICSSSRCVCTLLPYRVPICGGWRQTISFAEPSLVSGFKKKGGKERKSATNHDGIDCFASKRLRDFDRVVAPPKNQKAMERCNCSRTYDSALEPPFLYRLHKLYTLSTCSVWSNKK